MKWDAILKTLTAGGSIASIVELVLKIGALVFLVMILSAWFAIRPAQPPEVQPARPVPERVYGAKP